MIDYCSRLVVLILLFSFFGCPGSWCAVIKLAPGDSRIGIDGIGKQGYNDRKLACGRHRQFHMGNLG